VVPATERLVLLNLREVQQSMGTKYRAVDDSTDTCSRALQVLLLVLIGTAFAFSFLAMMSCEFFIYKGDIESRQNTTLSVIVENLEAVAFASLDDRLHSIGLFRFTDPDNTDVCWVWPDPVKDMFSWQFQTARWGAFFGCILTGFALLALLFEFTLCRFVCGRCFVTLCLLGGFFGLLLSGVVFVSGELPFFIVR